MRVATAIIGLVLCCFLLLRQQAIVGGLPNRGQHEIEFDDLFLLVDRHFDAIDQSFENVSIQRGWFAESDQLLAVTFDTEECVALEN